MVLNGLRNAQSTSPLCRSHAVTPSSPISSVEDANSRYHEKIRENVFGTGLCWDPRPVVADKGTGKGDHTQGVSLMDVDGEDVQGLGTLGHGGRGDGDNYYQREPMGEETEVGQACFLSSLLALCQHLRKLPEDSVGSCTSDGYTGEYGDNEMLRWVMKALMTLLTPGFPPAALALDQLSRALYVTEADCACLTQCLWGLAREVVPRPYVPDKRVFEDARGFLAWLVYHAQEQRSTRRQEAEASTSGFGSGIGDWKEAVDHGE